MNAASHPSLPLIACLLATLIPVFFGKLAVTPTWLSLQALDPAPSAAPEMTPVKKQLVVDGTELADRMARKHKVKLAWGTDIMFDPTLAENQSPDILKIEQ